MKRVIVTGGAGFIGSECVRQLVLRENVTEIIIIDSLTYAGDIRRIESCLESPKVKFVSENISNTSSYSHFFPNIDTVFHFAAESHVDRSINNGFPFLNTNVLGTFTLIDSLKHFNDVHLILISTDEVYGSVFVGESVETDRLLPSSTYSSSKASSDLIGLASRHTFDQKITVTRSCNNYGSWQHREKVMPNFILSALAGKRMAIYGSGENIREWIHVSDHVAALIFIAENKIFDSVINIGSAERISNLELADLIAQNLEIGDNYFEFVQDRLGHDFRYAINSDKIRKFGWHPKIKLLDGVNETISWYKSRFLNNEWIP